MLQSTNFMAIAHAARDGYKNRVIAHLNDHEVHISVMDAPYRWHFHPVSDETFVGIEGTLVIDFDDGSVELNVGEILTIPAGVRHCTRPKGARSVNLTVEQKDTETVFCDSAA